MHSETINSTYNMIYYNIDKNRYNVTQTSSHLFAIEANFWMKYENPAKDKDTSHCTIEEKSYGKILNLNSN